MEKILAALDKNTKITSDVKEDMKLNLYILFSRFPGIDKNHIVDRLSKLEITALPKLGEYEDVKVEKNTVFVSPSALEEKDSQNISMQVLLKGIFPNNNPKLEALYNGTTEMIANSLVGHSSESDEYVICDLLQEVMNLENMPNSFESAYFSGNFGMLLPYLQNCFTPTFIDNICAMSNQNYMRKKTQDTSLFPEIEKMLIEVFYSKNPSKEDTNRFEVKLLLNPNFFGDKAFQYRDLDTVAEFHDNLKLETLSTSLSSPKTI